MSTELFSNTSRFYLSLLKKIQNTCINTDFFPPQWKVATIAAIPKHNKPSKCPKCYRPISLLNTIGQFSIDNNILPPPQYGFWHKKIPPKLISHPLLHWNQRRKLRHTFLDFNCAWLIDSVWYKGLIKKFRNLKFSIPTPRSFTTTSKIGPFRYGFTLSSRPTSQSQQKFSKAHLFLWYFISLFAKIFPSPQHYILT